MHMSKSRFRVLSLKSSNSACSPSATTNLTAYQFSKMNDRNGAPAVSLGRKTGQWRWAPSSGYSQPEAWNFSKNELRGLPEFSPAKGFKKFTEIGAANPFSGGIHVQFIPQVLRCTLR